MAKVDLVTITLRCLTADERGYIKDAVNLAAMFKKLAEMTGLEAEVKAHVSVARALATKDSKREK